MTVEEKAKSFEPEVVQCGRQAVNKGPAIPFVPAKKRKSGWKSHGTRKVRSYIKEKELKLKQNRFSGHDKIRVLNFLVKFVKESSIQGMRQAQE